MVGLASPRHRAATMAATSQRLGVSPGAAGSATTAPRASTGKAVHVEWTASAAHRQSRTGPHWTEGRLSAATSLPVHRGAHTNTNTMSYTHTQMHAITISLTHTSYKHISHAQIHICPHSQSLTLTNTSMQSHIRTLTHVQNYHTSAQPMHTATHSYVHTLCSHPHGVVHTLVLTHVCTHTRAHLCAWPWVHGGVHFVYTQEHSGRCPCPSQGRKHSSGRTHRGPAPGFEGAPHAGSRPLSNRVWTGRVTED